MHQQPSLSTTPMILYFCHGLWILIWSWSGSDPYLSDASPCLHWWLRKSEGFYLYNLLCLVAWGYHYLKISQCFDVWHVLLLRKVSIIIHPNAYCGNSLVEHLCRFFFFFNWHKFESFNTCSSTDRPIILPSLPITRHDTWQVGQLFDKNASMNEYLASRREGLYMNSTARKTPITRNDTERSWSVQNQRRSMDKIESQASRVKIDRRIKQ